jgi:3-oxoacid CoA-transferase subunit B
MSWTGDQMAARAALELSDGDYVNLGIGAPARVPSHIPADVEVVLQSENGVLGTGDYLRLGTRTPTWSMPARRRSPCDRAHPSAIPPRMVKGMGGSMDLVHGATGHRAD